MAVLETIHLGKSYGEFEALRDVNITVESGECYGLIGPNGAGKSTLMRIATGILSRFEGDCSLFDMDIRSCTMEVKEKIGYLPEEPSLYGRPTARNLLTYFARLYGIRDGIDERAEGVLDLVGLRGRSDDRVATFSKGMRQRLAIARAIIHDPDLLMLDEPTMGLDPATADRVRKLILDQRESGRTILICTHYMEEAELLCDRIGIMDRGSLIVSGGIEEIKEGCVEGIDRIEVVLRCVELDGKQLSVFDSYELTPRGIVGVADLNSAYEALRPNGIISIRRLMPSLKDSFVKLTEGVGDS